MTTLSAQLDYALMENWTMSAGYMMEKYDFKDAYNANDRLLPSSINIFTKPNDGKYNANDVVFARLSYKF